MRNMLLAAGALGAVTLGLGAEGPAAADPMPMGPVQCDRACLQGMVDAYLVAVVAHDPSNAALV